MRRTIGATALLVLAAACTGTTEPAPSPTPRPVEVPAGTPPSHDQDAEPSEVPPEALIPPNTSVTDVWFAETSAGSAILVAFVGPGTDPFRQSHGLIVWRRFPGGTPPWRPVFGLADAPDRGVVQIRAIIGDATGDGSPDALTFEDMGGSGACGTWRVLDLAANAEVYHRKTCDTTIDLSNDPVGLVVREAVFAEGDAHCCPSATRSTVLVLDSTAWVVDSTVERPT
jgi:hypothetical protein